MSIKLKPVSQQVIVITGASSGIGLATAKEAAAAGAKVVLSARSRDALAQAVDEIKQAGGEAAFVVADVTEQAELEAVAATAIDRFGGFDSWVNNAGVGIWGMIEEVSDEDMRQLFEINFWGTVNGCRVALSHLKEKGGAIINIGSLTSDRAFPVQGIYSASKQAVKGFTDALRMELEHENAPVSVTLVKPGSIGTPMPQHVKNYHAEEANFVPPIYAPEEVARTVLRAAAHPLRETYVGGGARLVGLLAGVTPGLLDWVSARFLVAAQFGDRPQSPGDNLYRGEAKARVRGDHQGKLIRPSLYSRAARSPGITLAAAGLAAAAGASVFLWGRSSGAPRQSRAPDRDADRQAQEALEGHPT